MEANLPQRQSPVPEVVEHESCYLFRFPLPDSAAGKVRLEIIDNELRVRNLASDDETHYPSFVFPRAIEAEQSRAVVIHGALTVIVPKRSFTKHFQLPIETESPGRWNRLFNKQPYNHYFVESPRIAHPHIVTGYPEPQPASVAMTTTDRPECL